MKARSPVAYVLICLFAASANAFAAPAKSPLEKRYLASRDAAIEKLKPINDSGTAMADAAIKAEEAARAELETQMRAILGPLGYTGFGPGKLNLDTLLQGDQGFGMLDGLRFDTETGKTGEPAGRKGADGNYVVPKAHIIVTTQTLFAGWLRAHKNWWDKGARNVPQQIGAALKHESLYTQAISTDSAVVKFSALPVARPAAATLVTAMLAARTQDEIPNAADEVFVSALSNGKVYVAYGSIDPTVRIAACDAIRSDFTKRSTQADEDLQQRRIDQAAFDKLGNLRQRGEDAFKRCFAQRAPMQPAFAEATKQAQALLETALAR